MRVAWDIDGTLDEDPATMASLMNALRAAGHDNVILTGASDKQPTRADWDAKAAYLKSLGMGSAWQHMVVFGDPPHKAKAKWCKKHNVDLLIDNSAENAELSAKHCTVLVPWNSMIDAKREVVHDEGT